MQSFLVSFAARLESRTQHLSKFWVLLDENAGEHFRQKFCCRCKVQHGATDVSNWGSAGFSRVQPGSLQKINLRRRDLWLRVPENEDRRRKSWSQQLRRGGPLGHAGFGPVPWLTQRFLWVFEIL